MNIRFHDNETQGLHLLDPLFVSLSEPWRFRPLVLTPECFRFIRILDWTIKVDALMIISLAVGNILFQSRVSCPPYEIEWTISAKGATDLVHYLHS